MNLSNKTDQWRGKFPVSAKEKQLNTLQSAEVGNRVVFMSNARVSDSDFENGKVHGKIILLSSNSGTVAY